MRFEFDWKKIKDYLKKNYRDLFFSFLGIAYFLFFVVTGARVLRGDVEPPLSFAQLEGLVLIMFGLVIYNFWNRFKNALKEAKKQ